MIDLVLFIGRVVLVVVLYLFLFAVMRTGVGLVRGQRRDAAIWSVDVEKGTRSLRGLHVDILGPVIIGRSPSSDIVVDEPSCPASTAPWNGTAATCTFRTWARPTERSSTGTPSRKRSRCATPMRCRSATRS